MDSFYPCEGQLYFCYGLWMNPDMLAEKEVHADVLTLAKLADHRVDFFGHATIWDSGQETVVPDRGLDVWGVVYRLSYRNADCMDVWQDARLDGSGSYFHYPAVVVGQDGVHYPTLVYKKDVCGDVQLPSEEFLARIVAGARARGLPTAYVTQLADRTSRKASYPVPRKSRFDRSLLVGVSCEGCG